MSDVVVRLLKVRVRGVSLVEALALVCLAVLVICVYMFKAGASQEGARISDLDRQITAELRDVRHLREEVSRLEQPARIEQLSSQYLSMKPVRQDKDMSPGELAARLHNSATAQAKPAGTVQP